MRLLCACLIGLAVLLVLGGWPLRAQSPPPITDGRLYTHKLTAMKPEQLPPQVPARHVHTHKLGAPDALQRASTTTHGIVMLARPGETDPEKAIPASDPRLTPSTYRVNLDESGVTLGYFLSYDYQRNGATIRTTDGQTVFVPFPGGFGGAGGQTGTSGTLAMWVTTSRLGDSPIRKETALVTIVSQNVTIVPTEPAYNTPPEEGSGPVFELLLEPQRPGVGMVSGDRMRLRWNDLDGGGGPAVWLETWDGWGTREALYSHGNFEPDKPGSWRLGSSMRPWLEATIDSVFADAYTDAIGGPAPLTEGADFFNKDAVNFVLQGAADDPPRIYRKLYWHDGAVPEPRIADALAWRRVFIDIESHEATPERRGLMSAADKMRLDAVGAGGVAGVRRGRATLVAGAHSLSVALSPVMSNTNYSVTASPVASFFSVATGTQRTTSFDLLIEHDAGGQVNWIAAP